MRHALPTWARRLVQHRAVLVRRQWHFGLCPICEGPTVFLVLGEQLRTHYRCLRCWSQPRHRALIQVLNKRIPHWREARVHEFAPGRDGAAWFRRRCKGYSYSHFWPDVTPGTERAGIRCEDLARLTYGDHEFDVVISQDVFEHLPDPGAAAAEIARVLRPGGAHVFTVPVYPRPTMIRAEAGTDGTIRHILPPDYHGNPADACGSLVFTEWGRDIVDFVESASGLDTEMITLSDRRRGLAGGWLDVVVSSSQGSAPAAVS